MGVEMDETSFWSIVSEMAEVPADKKAAAWTKRLAQLDGAGVLAFHRELARRVHAAYRFDLMAVANLVNRTPVGEDFDAFVGWLIEKGRTYFEAALADPLRAGDDAELGAAKSMALWKAPEAAYRQVTGRDDFSLEAMPISLVMEGDKLSEADVKERFAELIARFGAPT